MERATQPATRAVDCIFPRSFGQKILLEECLEALTPRVSGIMIHAHDYQIKWTEMLVADAAEHPLGVSTVHMNTIIFRGSRPRAQFGDERA